MPQENTRWRALPTTLQGESLAVSASDVSKRYGGRAALDHLSLQVPVGSIYLLIGPNGAGKSTFLRTLVDLTRPDAGSIEVLGLGLASSREAVRAQIGYVPETGEWGAPWMRVRDAIAYHATFYPSWDEEYATSLLQQFDSPLHERLGTLSKGQARRLHLAMALAHRPALLVLDEPTSGLDPLILDQTLGILAAHVAATPTTVLLSTHQLNDLEHFADYVGILRTGRVILQAPRDEVIRMFRRYRFAASEAVAATIAAGCAVFHESRMSGVHEYLVWGEPVAVRAHIVTAGAELHDERDVTLSAAAVALMAAK